MRRPACLVVAVMINASCAASAGAPHRATISAPARHAPAATVSASSYAPLELDVSPRIMRVGDHASVRLRIEPDARSRAVDLSWWSDDGVGGSHLIPVDGERAPIRHEFPLKHLTPGHYDITAVLARADGSRVRRSVTILVAGR